MCHAVDVPALIYLSFLTVTCRGRLQRAAWGQFTHKDIWQPDWSRRGSDRQPSRQTSRQTSRQPSRQPLFCVMFVFPHSCSRWVRSPRIQERTAGSSSRSLQACRRTDRSEGHTAGRAPQRRHSRTYGSRSTSRSQTSHPERRSNNNLNDTRVLKLSKHVTNRRTDL